MQIKNLATASVAATAGGTFILTVDEANAQQGMTCLIVNPDVEIALVDNQGVAAAVPGTFANSPVVCPAGVPTTILHTSGPIKAITASGTATVKRAIGCAP